MATRELMRLPQTNFSGLDYDNIITDIINLIQDNPKYNTGWDDFTSADSGRLLIEFFSYIADQLATRIDWFVNENFISTATLKNSAMKILKIIGYNFTLPISSSVDIGINLTTEDWAKFVASGFYLTMGYENGDTGWEPFSLTATGKDGSSITFELLDYNANTGVYNYTTGIALTEDATKTFYEGKTEIDTFTAETDNNPIFTLTSFPVVENSVLVRLIGDSGGSVTESDLLEVSSFLDPNAQKEEYSDGTSIPIPYILNVEENDTITIEFAPISLLSLATRRLAEGQQIRVVYRVGGGKNGNIVKQTINTTNNLLVTPVAGGSQVAIAPSFINENEGVGGSDGETAEHAAVYAPLQIRTVDKAVTSEDYGILLDAHENIITSKAYGNFNLPSNIYDLYSLYIRPMEVWIYITPNNATNWSKETVVSSEYNNFQWMTYRLENRFNGIYDFTEGAFNNSAAISNDNMHIGDTFVDWWGDTDYTFYQEVGLSFYDGDTESGCTDGDSYYFNINGDSYKISITAGDSTFFNRIVVLMNDQINGDSFNATIVGDTGSMDIRISFGDTWVNLQHANQGDTLWVAFTGWSDFDTSTSDNYGDTFRNLIFVETPQALKTSLQSCLVGDSYFRTKVSTSSDSTQQFRNIADLICGDSLYGDTCQDATWRISENINAYLQSNTNVETGLNMITNYKMKISADGDTYVIMDLRDGAVDPNKVRSYEIMYNINRAFFESFGYGDSGDTTGDTSYGDSTGLLGVASVVESSGNEYIKLTSPKTGDSSKISIMTLDANDIGDSLFGSYISGDTGDTFHCYGKRRLTIITKASSNDFGKIIYEPATLNLSGNGDTLFIHYLNNNETSIVLGDYFYNNYIEGQSPWKWRAKAPRIYNSYFANSGDSVVTIVSSDFQIKLTKTATESMSLWNIGDSWSLTAGKQPNFVGDTTLGDSIFIPATKRYIKVNVDSKGDTTLDLWAITGDSGWYNTEGVALDLNTHLQDSYYAYGATYTGAVYFSLVNHNMVLKSPTITNTSSVKIMPTSNDGAPLLFGSSFGGDTQYTEIVGDYFLEYDSSLNMMKLTKTNDSQMPDLDFYCHFINDRRYKPSSSLSEDTYESYLENKKIIAIEHVFKQTKFSTFDLDGVIHYNSSFTVGQVSAGIATAMENNYTLLNNANENKRTYGQKVYRSKILDLIQSVSGVEYVVLSYFGKDATDSFTNQTDYIDCGFDEIVVLSDNVMVDNIQKHGILFRYEMVSE